MASNYAFHFHLALNFRLYFLKNVPASGRPRPPSGPLPGLRPWSPLNRRIKHSQQTVNQDNKQHQLTVTGIKRRRRRMQEHLICMFCLHAAYIHTVSMRSRLCTAVCSFCPSPSELLSPSRNSIRPSVRPDVFCPDAAASGHGRPRLRSIDRTEGSRTVVGLLLSRGGVVIARQWRRSRGGEGGDRPSNKNIAY